MDVLLYYPIILWESFHSLSEIPIFGEDTKTDSGDETSTCCIPLNLSQPNNKQAAVCCIPNEDDVAGAAHKI